MNFIANLRWEFNTQKWGTMKCTPLKCTFTTNYLYTKNHWTFFQLIVCVHCTQSNMVAMQVSSFYICTLSMTSPCLFDGRFFGGFNIVPFMGLMIPTRFHHHYKMWVQFTNPHSLYQRIHCFPTSSHLLRLVNSLKI
jgi:hypothetical protein